MSELKNVGVVISSLKLPEQNYEHLITFFDIYDDPHKRHSVLTDNRFDLFGFLPKGFFFKNKTTIERVVNIFNKSPQTIAFLVCPPVFNGECPYFINKKILTVDSPVRTLPEMLLFVEEHGLESRKATEKLFVYG